MRPSQRDWKESDAGFSPSANPLIAILYQRYSPKLLSYLSQHIVHTADAEDLLFEVFLSALEHEQELASMQEDTRRAWMWTVARNKVIDYHRRRLRRPVVPLEHIAEMADEDWTPEQSVLRQEERENLHTYLRQLSTLQQEVLQLRFTGGLRCTEIAVVLNKSDGAIRTMLSRALNILRNICEQEEEQNV